MFAIHDELLYLQILNTCVRIELHVLALQVLYSYLCSMRDMYWKLLRVHDKFYIWYLKNMGWNLPHIVHMYRSFLRVVHSILLRCLAQDEKCVKAVSLCFHLWHCLIQSVFDFSIMISWAFCWTVHMCLLNVNRYHMFEFVASWTAYVWCSHV